ncbi:MAG: O-antigen ligase family protein [Nitrospinales bacterium]
MQKIKVPLLCKGQSLNVGVLFVLVFGGAALLEAVVGLAQWLKFSWPDWGWSYRPYGSMENPISFAIVLMIAGLFSFAHLVFNRISVNWILFLLLFGLGLLVSFTREAWIGFFVGALFLAAIHGWRWLAGSFGIFILLYWLLPDILQSRIATMITLEGSSISERFHLWRAALYIWIDHPWVGCGFSCIESIHEAFPDHAVLKSEHFIHNSYLQILVDTGLIGLTAWMAIWVKFFAQAFRSFKNPQYFLCPDWVRFGGCAAILAFLVASLFKTHFYDQEMVMVIYAVMAFTLAPSAAMPLPSGPRSIPVSAKSPRSAKGGQIDVKSGEILPDKPS